MVNRVLKMTAPCFSEIVGLLEAMNDDAVAFDAGAESRFTRIERRLSSGVISTSCILTPTTSAAVSRRASIVEPQTTMVRVVIWDTALYDQSHIGLSGWQFANAKSSAVVWFR